MVKLHGEQLEECDNDLFQGQIISLLILRNVSYILGNEDLEIFNSLEQSGVRTI